MRFLFILNMNSLYTLELFFVDLKIYYLHLKFASMSYIKKVLLFFNKLYVSVYTNIEFFTYIFCLFYILLVFLDLKAFGLNYYIFGHVIPIFVFLLAFIFNSGLTVEIFASWLTILISIIVIYLFCVAIVFILFMIFNFNFNILDHITLINSFRQIFMICFIFIYLNKIYRMPWNTKNFIRLSLYLCSWCFNITIFSIFFAYFINW